MKCDNCGKNNANVKFIKDGKYLAAYGSEGITAYDAAGNTVWSAGVSLEDPRAVCAGDFFVVADIGGRSFYIVDQNGDPATPVEVSTTADILEISVSKNGRVAVLMQENDGHRIQIIDPYAKNQVMAEIVTTKEDGFALGIALSDDGSKLVTDYFKNKNSALITNLTFYNFSSTGENVGADRIVGAFNYKDELFGELTFTDNNTVVCVGDSSVRTFAFNHEPSLKWQKKINGKIERTKADSKSIGFLISINSELHAAAFSIDKGDMLYDEKAGIDVLGMELCNGEMTIYSGNRCRIFYPNGKIKYDGEGEENMVLVTRTHINDKYFVISGNHIDVIKFN